MVYSLHNSAGETPITLAARLDNESVVNYLSLRQNHLNYEDLNG